MVSSCLLQMSQKVSAGRHKEYKHDTCTLCNSFIELRFKSQNVDGKQSDNQVVSTYVYHLVMSRYQYLDLKIKADTHIHQSFVKATQ